MPAVVVAGCILCRDKALPHESTVTYEYVKDGRFSLANGNLSFKMPEDWKLASASIAYQFASTDEYNENKFNLVVSKTNSPIEDVTSEQMTATYKATMEDFKLVDFQHPGYAEYSQKGCTKATGMEIILKHCGIDRAHSIAMGDSSNDTDMLKYAGISVAMGDAEEEIKSICDYVSCPAAEGGVAKAIYKFLNI